MTVQEQCSFLGPWRAPGSAPGPVPLTRATTFARPGADSSSTGSRPASASRAATYSAAGRSRASPPPRLVVSILIRSAANRAASSPATIIGQYASKKGRSQINGRVQAVRRGAPAYMSIRPNYPLARSK